MIFPVTFDLALTRLNACVMYGRLSVYIAWAGVRSVQPVEACESCMTSITCFVKLNRANRAARPTQHDNETLSSPLRAGAVGDPCCEAPESRKFRSNPFVSPWALCGVWLNG